MAQQEEHPLRRASDRAQLGMFGQCPQYHNHEDIDQIKRDLEEIKRAVGKVSEILDAWNNARGFVNTLAMLGKVVKWLAVVGGALTALWAALRYGVHIKGE